MSEPNPPENAGHTVEIDDGRTWTPVCRYEDLVPGRGVAVLVGPQDEQVAVFRERGGTVHALDNHDPFSGAHVISRGLLGSRGGVPVVISPMLKQAFDLRTGRCLDEDHAPDGSTADLRVWPVRVVAATLAEVRR
ncbi:nitrite reductase small subunit NirD [Streptomyces sp. NBC_01217]|uniref:nitrite reductase small subunit NirD n=1 Tax=Streptomyces sp. NBC_01217 TaxID=2903779 RepID=UPI002E0F8951|nr:nitrite reductase small subunit NirD [Streptomyces sp. NBC_01217]